MLGERSFVEIVSARVLLLFIRLTFPGRERAFVEIACIRVLFLLLTFPGREILGRDREYPGLEPSSSSSSAYFSWERGPLVEIVCISDSLFLLLTSPGRDILRRDRECPSSFFLLLTFLGWDILGRDRVYP